MALKITFDPGKNVRNVAERGIPFELASIFDWSTAVVVEDSRRDYGEPRFRAFGFIADRLHVLVYTPRSGTLRVISLRCANQREKRFYASNAQT